MLTRRNIREIKIGNLPIVPTLPVYVAVEKGYFEEEGIGVTITQFKTSDQLAEAVLKGDVDFAGVISTSVLITLEQKSPKSFRIISENILSSRRPLEQIIVSNDSTINSIEELEGKKLGIFPGSTSRVITKIAFKNLFGREFNVEYVPVPPNLWLESLSNGSVDALLTYEPFTTLIVLQGKGRVLYDGICEKHVMDNLPGGVTVIRSQLAEESPEIADKIERAIEKAIEYIKSNEKEARLIATKYIPITEEVASKMNLPEFHIAEEIDINKLQELLKDELLGKEILVVENVEKSFRVGNNILVLAGVNMKVKRGSFISIFGPNGCGKTTLFNIISGIDKPDKGNIYFWNSKPKISYIFQNFSESLFPWLRCIDNICFPLDKLDKNTKVKKVEKLLSDLGIDNIPLNNYPYQCSGGQKQLTAIARALITDPDILLLDEPFAALDFGTRLMLEDKILDIWEKKKITILFISHDIDEAIYLADKVIVFSKKPSKIIAEIEVNLPRPRNHTMLSSKEFADLRLTLINEFHKAMV